MFKILKKATTQTRRTPYQALAAVMVLSLTFFAATIFTFLFFGAYKVLRHFESAPQVIAFFEKGEDLSETQIASIKAKLEGTGKLASFKYVSTREAEAIYKEKNKDDPLLLELVDYKILPPSIEISASEIEDLSQLKEILEGQAKVTDIVFYEDIVNTLTVWIKNLHLVGLALIVYLTLQSILRLLGGSFWFIAGPFLTEGIIYGVLGAFFGFLIATTLLLYSTPLLVNWLAEIPLLPISYFFLAQILGVEILAGILIGTFASFIGVRRFLPD